MRRTIKFGATRRFAGHALAPWLVVSVLGCGVDPWDQAAEDGDLKSSAVVQASSSCTQQTAAVTDPNTGWPWSSRWVCGNRANAALYGDTYRLDAAAQTQTGIMKSTSSWFVCYRRGATHAGGNNVWYYTKGDVAVSPFQRRSAWGYMPAVDVWTSIDPWPGVPECPVGRSPPPRVDGLNKPVYFIHGYDLNGVGFDANGSYWSSAISAYRTSGDPASLSGTLGRAWTWCYYSNDTNCDLKTVGDRNVPIKQLGQDLAWEIYDHFSRFGDSVDVVGHSMGGLAIRAAITGVQKGESGWPPYLYVEDVSTLSTPHRGAPVTVIGGCDLQNTQQCRDMRWDTDPTRRSDFFKWLNENPQSAQGTDWTLIGFDDDLFIPAWSALAQDSANRFGHSVVFWGDQFLPKIDAHMLPLWATSGTYRTQFCDYFWSCDMANRGTWGELDGNYDPVKIARYGNYYMSTW